MTILAGLAIILSFLVIGLRGIFATNLALYNNGHRQWWTALIVLVPIPIGFLLPIIISVVWRTRGAYENLVLGAAAAIGLGFANLITVAIVRRLPKGRRKRPQQLYRFPFRVFIIPSLVAIPIVSVLALLMGTGAKMTLALTLLAVQVCRAVVSTASSQLVSSAAQAMQKDPRDPALYIRPFMTDPYVFDKRPRRGLLRYIPVPDRSTAETGIRESNYQTFESFVSEDLRATVGPLIALGCPFDNRPQGDGAARVYYSDDEWQRGFAELASASICVLCVADTSENLAWELRYLVDQGMADKLFICTAPYAKDPVETAILRSWSIFFGRRALIFWGVSRPPWNAVAKQLRTVGYRPPVEDPRQGAVLHAEVDGTLRVIIRGARSAQDYVGAINAELQMQSTTS